MKTISMAITILSFSVIGCEAAPKTDKQVFFEPESRVAISEEAVIVNECAPVFECVSGYVDAASMVTKVEQIIGEPLGGDMNTSDGVLRAETASFSVKVDTTRGVFAVLSKSAFPEVATENLATSEEIFAATEEALGTLGITDAETANIADLYGQTRSIGGLPEAPVALARKVLVNRTVGGVPVVGDRLVVSFGMDGSFRGLHGRWTPMDTAKSSLAVDMSETEIEKMIENEMASSISGDYPVEVRTVLVPDGLENRIEDTAPYPRAMRLAWEVGVQTTGPDGPSYTAWRIIRPPLPTKEVGE